MAGVVASADNANTCAPGCSNGANASIGRPQNEMVGAVLYRPAQAEQANVKAWAGRQRVSASGNVARQQVADAVAIWIARGQHRHRRRAAPGSRDRGDDRARPGRRSPPISRSINAVRRRPPTTKMKALSTARPASRPSSPSSPIREWSASACSAQHLDERPAARRTQRGSQRLRRAPGRRPDNPRRASAERTRGAGTAGTPARPMASGHRRPGQRRSTASRCSSTADPYAARCRRARGGEQTGAPSRCCAPERQREPADAWSASCRAGRRRSRHAAAQSTSTGAAGAAPSRSVPARLPHPQR